MSPAAPDLAPAGDEEHRFFLAPLRHTKTLYLIRHGEGYHNFFGERDREMYKSEKFFDAHLDPKGWAQCAALRQHLERATTHDGAESLLDRIECVVVSPLMRALETAVGSLGGDHLATEEARSAESRVMMRATSEVEGHSPRPPRDRAPGHAHARAPAFPGVRAVPRAHRLEPVRPAAQDVRVPSDVSGRGLLGGDRGGRRAVGHDERGQRGDV